MTYCVVRTVYYGPDRTMYRGRIRRGASFDEAWETVARWRDEDLCRLNVMYGDGAFTDMLLWPSQKRCRHITKIAPSLKYCGSFSESQPREIVYEIWEEAEPDKNHKEEKIMTNEEMAKKIKELEEKLDGYHRDAEMAKQIKELNGRLDSCRYAQDKHFVKYDADIRRLNDILGRYSIEHDERFDADNDRIKHLDDKLEEQAKLLQQFETALMQLRLNISSVSSVYGIPEKAKTIESMYPCLWNCGYKGKECNGQAQECPIAEHFSNLLENGLWRHSAGSEWVPYSYCKNDADTMLEMFRFRENKKDIIFSEFNAGKRAIVFSDSDYLEKDYLDFWREFDKWCSTSETEDKLYPQSKWTTRERRMNPLMKCQSIYEDRSSFAIWVEHNDEEGEHTFEYGTLQSTWREHNTVGGLPYTEWSV